MSRLKKESKKKLALSGFLNNSSEDASDSWYQSKSFPELSFDDDCLGLDEVLEKQFPDDAYVLFRLSDPWPGGVLVYLLYSNLAEVDEVRFPAEVVHFSSGYRNGGQDDRNGWTTSNGISGQLAPENASDEHLAGKLCTGNRNRTNSQKG